MYKINMYRYELVEETIMKTKEELNALKEEIETLNKKLAELTEDELEQVTGGIGDIDILIPPSTVF